MERLRSFHPRMESLETRLNFSGFSSLGVTSLIESAAGGSDSDLVLASATVSWTASTTDNWIHTSSSGMGNGLATFTFDANSGATRTGTLTIAGQTLTVTEAGSGYEAAGSVTLASSGIPGNFSGFTPYNMATDSSGNIFFANYTANDITEWNPTTQTLTNVVSSGLSNPGGVAVDSSGNLYIADTGHNAIKEWNATTQTLTTVISSGLNKPNGVAVDSSGNLYIADTNNGVIREWNASTGIVTPVVSTPDPIDVVLDGAGNLYYGSYQAQTVSEWNVSNQSATTLFSLQGQPMGLAVDGAGNVYAACSYQMVEWHPSTQTVTTIEPTRYGVLPDVAVDGSGNIYYVYNNYTGSDSSRRWAKAPGCRPVAKALRRIHIHSPRYARRSRPRMPTAMPTRSSSIRRCSPAARKPSRCRSQGVQLPVRVISALRGTSTS
jgi:streptogramin lyase